MGQSLLLAAKDFLTNNLATIVAGGFGAYFGAWSAQAIIARKQDRQSVVAELNSINAVLAADFMITMFSSVSKNSMSWGFAPDMRKGVKHIKPP